MNKTSMNRFQYARMNMTGKPLEVVAEESGVSKNTIWKLEHNKVDAGYKVVGKLAEYYGVNVAWLVGQSDSPSLDESRQMITDTTGLTDKALNMVQFMKRNKLSDTLNILLESDDFKQMVKWFKTARIVNQHCTESDKTTEIDDAVYQGSIEDTNGEAIQYAYFPGESHIDMCLLRASKALDHAFTAILKEDKNNG